MYLVLIFFHNISLCIKSLQTYTRSQWSSRHDFFPMRDAGIWGCLHTIRRKKNETLKNLFTHITYKRYWYSMKALLFKAMTHNSEVLKHKGTFCFMLPYWTITLSYFSSVCFCALPFNKKQRCLQSLPKKIFSKNKLLIQVKVWGCGASVWLVLHEEYCLSLAHDVCCNIWCAYWRKIDDNNIHTV